MAKKYRRSSVTVDVDIEWCNFDDDDLIEELKERGYSVLKGTTDDPFDFNDLNWIYEAIQQNRKADALSLLDRLIRPKWKSPEDCQKAFSEIKSSAA